MIPFTPNVALAQTNTPAQLVKMGQTETAEAKMERRRRKRKHR